jgi:lipopolysaccharide biosynthesis glycosyltransferase
MFVLGPAMTAPIHIALAFDDNFWAPAYTVMRSVCLSTHRRKDLVFHLLHMPVTDEHRDDLEGITREFEASLRWYPLDKSELFDFLTANLPNSARWPKVVYARMVMSDLLPKEIERIIYLDCDMLVRAPIENLYELDLRRHVLGAVQDAPTPFIVGGRNMRQNVGIFDTADPYFNSGMLLIDLPKWRDLDIRAELAVMAGKGWIEKLYYDQDILNLIFKGRWLALPWRWNTIDAHMAHEALNPAILHYTLPAKPWGFFAGMRRSSAHARWYRHVMTKELFFRFMRHRWKNKLLKFLRWGR